MDVFSSNDLNANDLSAEDHSARSDATNHEEDDTLLGRSSLSSASSSESSSRPKKKKAKVEAPVLGAGGYAGLSDPRMLALGSTAFHPPVSSLNPGFNLAFGTGLPMASLGQPMHSFPGTSPGYPSMLGMNHFYGYGTGFAVPQQAAAAKGGSDASDADSEDGSEGQGDGETQRKLSAGMPLVFAPTAGVARAPVPYGGVGHTGSFHPVLQVVSTDSAEGGVRPASVQPVPLFPSGSVVTLQKPKKWVRWSDHEDQVLRHAVEQWGEHNFRHISEQVFHGSRTEAQCKTRWKKALQPGLVKGQWTKEEDNFITQSVASGNNKWAEIAMRLPGRIGDQVKERWVNVLDPEIKRGIWTEEEMRVLRESQAELGNKWSEIAKRIRGRNENQVKNRWYNQKTSELRAKRKSLEQEQHEASAPERHLSPVPSRQPGASPRQQPAAEQAGPMMHPQLGQNGNDDAEMYENDADKYKDIFGVHDV